MLKNIERGIELNKIMKLVSLFIATSMVLSILQACSQSDPGADETQASVESSQQVQTEPVDASADPVEESVRPSDEPSDADNTEPVEAAAAEEKVEEPVIGPDYYYLADETTKISVTMSYMMWFYSMFPDGWASSPWWDAIEEDLNVEFIIQEFVNTTYQEKVNLMIAGDETTDIIVDLAGVYTGGLSAALSEEVIYDVAPYLEQYAPNYLAVLENSPDTIKAVSLDDGAQGALYSLFTEPQGVTDGLWIRTDWLRETNKEVPTTTAELKDVLTAFKTEYDSIATLYQRAGSNMVGIQVTGVWNAFGALETYIEDGEVKYGAVQPYYYDYIVFLRDLAASGLFLTSDFTDLSSNELFAQSQIGINGDSINNVPNYLTLLEDDDAGMKAMAAIGEPTELGPIVNLVAAGFCSISIFENCEYPELVVKAVDYLFTDQGSLLANYGIENLSFNFDQNGNPKFMDLIINNPDGIPLDATIGYYTSKSFLPGYLDPFRTYYNYYDYQLEASEIWGSAYSGRSMTAPALALTTEETDKISSLVADINTFITEFTNIAVFGDAPFTKESFDEFVNNMYEQNKLQTILDVYNEAYRRYLNR